MKTCSILGCNERHLAKGLCNRHYNAKKRQDPTYHTTYNQYAREWRKRPSAKAYLLREDVLFKRRFTSYQAHAKSKRLVFELDLETFVRITSLPCYYCGQFSRGRSHTGIDRVNSSLGYVTTNVVPCCTTCNKAKLDLTVDEFISHARHIVLFQDSKEKHVA